MAATNTLFRPSPLLIGRKQTEVQAAGTSSNPSALVGVVPVSLTTSVSILAIV